MKKVKSLLANNKPLIILIFFVGALAFLHQFVLLYGDDYYHSTAAGSFKEFLNFHIHHYLRGNGRALIHIAITLCFYGDGVLIWKIVSPILFGIVVYFASKAFFDKRDSTVAVSAMCATIFSLGGEFTSKSIYTLTPVFNYVYPFLFMLPLIFFLRKNYENKKFFVLLPIVGFFAGATMEQTGIMTIGYIVLMMLEKFIVSRLLPNKTLIFTFITSIIGYLTVMLAPGNFVRMETSTRPFAENFVAAFTMLINQKTFLLFNAFLICALCYWLIRIKSKNIIISCFNKLIVSGLIVGYFINFVIVLGIGGLNFDSNVLINLLWKAFDLGYIFSMVYVPLYVFVKEKRWDILTHAIISLGSIVILFFASVSEWRTLTPAIIIYAVFVGLTLADAKKYYVKLYKVIIIVAAFLSVCVFANNLYSVIQNYHVHTENEKRVAQYLEEADFDLPLVLRAVENEDTRGYGINIAGRTYTYPLPKDADLSAGYSLRYKEYYNIPIETTIKIE